MDRDLKDRSSDIREILFQYDSDESSLWLFYGSLWFKVMVFGQ